MLRLARRAANKHKPTPKASSETSFFSSPFLLEFDRRMMPIVEMVKTTTSCFVIRSPITKKASTDVRNGFSKIRIILDVDVNLSAIKISRWAIEVPTTLTIT